MYTIKCTYIHINICSFQEHNLDLNKCQNVNLPSKHGILRLHFPIPKLTTYSDQDPSFYACHHVTPSVHINSLYDCSNIFSRWLNLICSTKKHWAADCWLLSSIFTIMKLYGAESVWNRSLPISLFHWYHWSEHFFRDLCLDCVSMYKRKANIWLIRAK